MQSIFDPWFCGISKRRVSIKRFRISSALLLIFFARTTTTMTTTTTSASPRQPEEGALMRTGREPARSLARAIRGRSRRLVALLAVVVIAASVGAGVAYTNSERHSGVPNGQGVGLYTDPSVANQVSTFTINRTLISCGVGTFEAGGELGPFDMLMYSTRIDEYDVHCEQREIAANGEMRSITRIGGRVVEDVRHHFFAHAFDLDGDEEQPRRDRFEVHFRTVFWQPGNPACTPSDRYPGLCRFGGRLFAGDVNVSCNGDGDGCPDEGDTDNDGLNNANELRFGLPINIADSDFDGIADGNDDSNGNGEDDEDEDDGGDCPDPDGDGDGVDDEDEDDDENQGRRRLDEAAPPNLHRVVLSA
jgi:hypothetical protein